MAKSMGKTETLEKLIDQRNRQGVSQRKMAKLLKISAATLNRYEKGSRGMSSELQERYADLLGYKIVLMLE